MAGRASAAATEAAELNTALGLWQKMPAKAPAELTDAQAAVWRDVVGAMPGGFMTPAAKPLLIEYCRHVCRARLLEAAVAGFDISWAKVEGGLERFEKILAMADRETKAIINLARQLRISPHSLIDPKTAGRASRNIAEEPTEMPWDEA